MGKKKSKIGPHEGIELSLMDSGEKPVALFAEVRPKDFDSFTQAEGISFFEFESPEKLGITVPIWIVYRDGYQDDARELQRLFSEVSVSSFCPEKERRIGEILSYSEDEIQAYIDQF